MNHCFDASKLSYLDQRNVIQDIESSYLNSLEHTNGLSGQSSTMDLDAKFKAPYNLESLAHMIDFTDLDFEKTMKKSYEQ